MPLGVRGQRFAAVSTYGEEVVRYGILEPNMTYDSASNRLADTYSELLGAMLAEQKVDNARQGPASRHHGADVQGNQGGRLAGGRGTKATITILGEQKRRRTWLADSFKHFPKANTAQDQGILMASK